MLASKADLHVVWEDHSAWVDGTTHKNSGDNKLESKFGLDITGDVGEELGDPGGSNSG